MYNTTVVCTYKNADVFLKSDNISDTEKKFVRDVIYRQELLNIFGIEEFNDTEIVSIIHKLYGQIKGNQFIGECMHELSKKILNTEHEYGLMIMFSYDYMDVTHICISELLDTGVISEINMLKLRSIVFLNR